MLDTTQYSMALYFYMYRAFDTSLLKHSYFCHVFTRESNGHVKKTIYINSIRIIHK